MGIEALGQNAFLRLLTTQLQFQDPLKPMESTEFISQLAQLRELESAVDTNKKLDTLVQRTETMNSLNAAGLVGRKVEVLGGGMTHQANQSETISYTLPEEATEVVIYINTPSGDVVKTLTAKELKKEGPHAVLWDGKDNKGNSAPSGNYTYDGVFVSRKTGKQIPMDIQANGEVSGISYKDGKVLASVNGSNVPIEKIVKILR